MFSSIKRNDNNYTNFPPFSTFFHKLNFCVNTRRNNSSINSFCILQDATTKKNVLDRNTLRYISVFPTVDNLSIIIKGSNAYHTTEIICHVIRQFTIHNCFQWSEFFCCAINRYTISFTRTLLNKKKSHPTLSAWRNLLSVSPSKLFVFIQHTLDAFGSQERRNTKSAGKISPSLTLTISPTWISLWCTLLNCFVSLSSTSTNVELEAASDLWRMISSRTI